MWRNGGRRGQRRGDAAAGAAARAAGALGGAQACAERGRGRRMSGCMWLLTGWRRAGGTASWRRASKRGAPRRAPRSSLRARRRLPPASQPSRARRSQLSSGRDGRGAQAAVCVPRAVRASLRPVRWLRRVRLALQPAVAALLRQPGCAPQGAVQGACGAARNRCGCMQCLWSPTRGGSRAMDPCAHLTARSGTQRGSARPRAAARSPWREPQGRK